MAHREQDLSELSEEDTLAVIAQAVVDITCGGCGMWVVAEDILEQEEGIGLWTLLYGTSWTDGSYGGWSGTISWVCECLTAHRVTFADDNIDF